MANKPIWCSLSTINAKMYKLQIVIVTGYHFAAMARIVFLCLARCRIHLLVDAPQDTLVDAPQDTLVDAPQDKGCM